MKLHLPHKFQAALMAALGAVAFPVLGTGTIAVATGACLLAGQQAQADEYTTNVMQTSQKVANDTPWTPTATQWGDTNVLSLTDIAASINITSAVSAYCNTETDYARSFYVANTNTGNGGTFDYTLTFTTSFGQGVTSVTLNSVTVDFFSVNASGVPQNDAKPLAATMSIAPSGESALASADVAVTIRAGNSNKAAYTGNAASGYALADGEQPGVVTLEINDGVTLQNGQTYVLTLANVHKTGGAGTMYGLGNVAFNYTTSGSAISTYTWAGTDGNDNWSAAVWTVDETTGQNFTSGSDAVFGDNAWKNVTVDTSVGARNISVDANGYVITVNADQTLTAKTLTIAEDASLSVSGEGAANVTNKVTCNGSLTVGSAMTIASLTGTGNITAGANGNVSVNALSSYTGTMSVTDGGTLNLGGDIILADLTVENGTVTTTHAGGNGVVTNTLTIGEDGTFKVAGGHDAFGYNNGKTKEIVIGGTADHVATLALEQTSGNSVTMSTNITMNGYAQITDASKNSKGFNTYGGNITVNDIENSIAIIDLRNAVTISVAEGGALAVNKFMRHGDSSASTTVTKTGAGTMSITGASELPGALNINAGTVSIGANTTLAGLNIAADGTLQITGGTTTVDGATNVLSNTITVSAGSLVLHGTYEIGGNTGEMETTYVGGATEGNGNGFEHVAGSSKVYTKAAEGASVNVDGATFTVGGQDVTSAVVDGVYTTQGTTNFETFYVKNGTESLDHALTFADGHTVSTVSLAEGTSINTDHAGATIGIAMQGSATVNATAATTLSSITGWSGNTLTITGGAEVSLMPGQDIVIGAGSSLLVNTDVDAQKIQLNGDGAHLTVDSGVELTLSNNLTLTKGVADVYGTVNVGHEVDLSNGAKAQGTLHIYGTGSVTAKDGMWMNHTAVGVLLEEGGTYAITGQGVSFTGKEGVGSITAQNAEVNYSTTNANAVISNIVMTATKDITIKNKLVNTSVVAGTHTVAVENAGNTIAGASVSEGGSFTMTSGTLTDVVTSTGGTVALSGITLGDSFEQQGGAATYVDLKGAEVTAGDNYYLGNTKGYVTVVTGTGEFSGSNISWGGETYRLDAEDGTITTKEAGTDYTTFYINKDSEQISDILAHEETKNVQVNSGTLVVNQDASGIAITVSTEGTITGEKADAKQVDIQKDAVAHYTGNVEASAVKFTAEQGKTVDITNKGDEGHKYSIGDAGMHVAAQKMELSAAATDDVVVNNHVSVETVENLSTHVLTLNDGKSEVENVFATHGDIKFYNTGDAIALVSMTIGEGKQVGAYTGTAATSTNEATVSISNMLTAGKDASLYANLVLESNSTLNLGGHFMYLGSQLTLQEGLIQFDDATLKAIAELDMHETLDLFQAADGTQLSYKGVSNEDWARTHFDLSSITDADYKIVANGDVFGIEKVSNIPEPATGTLSLLALAALAARRRRKG